MGQYYEIVSIERAEPPPDGKGSNWYRYVISFEGSNTITGCRQGSLKDVTSGMVEMIAQLNSGVNITWLSWACTVADMDYGKEGRLWRADIEC